eukprot:2838810-Rhodomonas_salina.1
MRGVDRDGWRSRGAALCAATPTSTSSSTSSSAATSIILLVVLQVLTNAYGVGALRRGRRSWKGSA